ncbi:MAG: hypothetical protein EBT21_05505 [Actinobacteria bacterium]|nr:hypothetical protein [Actinomycetota bacterium]
METAKSKDMSNGHRRQCLLLWWGQRQFAVYNKRVAQTNGFIHCNGLCEEQFLVSRPRSLSEATESNVFFRKLASDPLGDQCTQLSKVGSHVSHLSLALVQ